ncbi:hypothetical protein C5167_011840 [Papaver somniferum]|uniref:Uncharacterized protein n=1 Tax=Papaver somniferum TaxID=3469 RepID=A0A4Y7IVR9_PAPSO|nr:hypothetical protein C5167_011840 [Papaver somniferum]
MLQLDDPIFIKVLCMFSLILLGTHFSSSPLSVTLKWGFHKFYHRRDSAGGHVIASKFLTDDSSKNRNAEKKQVICLLDSYDMLRPPSLVSLIAQSLHMFYCGFKMPLPSSLLVCLNILLKMQWDCSFLYLGYLELWMGLCWEVPTVSLSQSKDGRSLDLLDARRKWFIFNSFSFEAHQFFLEFLVGNLLKLHVHTQFYDKLNIRHNMTSGVSMAGVLPSAVAYTSGFLTSSCYCHFRLPKKRRRGVFELSQSMFLVDRSLNRILKLKEIEKRILKLKEIEKRILKLKEIEKRR